MIPIRDGDCMLDYHVLVSCYSQVHDLILMTDIVGWPASGFKSGALKAARQ